MALLNDLITYIPFHREASADDRSQWYHLMKKCSQKECFFGIPLKAEDNIRITIKGDFDIPSTELTVYSYCIDGTDEQDLGTLENGAIGVYDTYSILTGEIADTPPCGIRYFKIEVSPTEVYYSEPVHVMDSDSMYRITLTDSCSIGNVNFSQIYGDSRNTTMDIFLPKEVIVGDPRIVVEEEFDDRGDGVEIRVRTKKETYFDFDTDLVPLFYYDALTQIVNSDTATIYMHEDGNTYNINQVNISEPEYFGGCYSTINFELLVRTEINGSCCNPTSLYPCPENNTREVESLFEDQTGVEIDDNIGKVYIPSSAIQPENPDWQYHLGEFATYQGSSTWTYETPTLYQTITDAIGDLFYYNGTNWIEIDDYVHIDEPTVVGGGCQFTITGFVPVNTWAVVQYSTTGADGTWSDLSSPLTTAEIITGFTTSLLSSPGDHYFRIRAINHNCILDESNIEFVQCV